MLADAAQIAIGAANGGNVLDVGNEHFVVEVFGFEDIIAGVARAFALFASVVVANALIFGVDAFGFLFGEGMIVLFGEVGGDIAEAGGEDNDAYLVVSEGGIGGQAVFEIDIGVDILHELVDVIHFIDLQRVNRIFGAEDGEAKRLGILNIAIVEEGRFECGIDGFAQTVLAGGYTGGHDGHSSFA